MGALSDVTQGNTNALPSANTAGGEALGTAGREFFGNRKYSVPLEKLNVIARSPHESVGLRDGCLCISMPNGTNISFTQNETRAVLGKYRESYLEAARINSPDSKINFKWYTTHSIPHIYDVVARCAEFLGNRNASPELTRLVVVSALYHDTGMANGRGVRGGIYCGGYHPTADGCRVFHATMSGIEVLFHRESIASKGVDPETAALVVAAHSKSASGLKILTRSGLADFVMRFRGECDAYGEKYGINVFFNAEAVIDRIYASREYAVELSKAIEIVSLADSATHSKDSNDRFENQLGERVFSRDFSPGVTGGHTLLDVPGVSGIRLPSSLIPAEEAVRRGIIDGHGFLRTEFMLDRGYCCVNPDPLDNLNYFTVSSDGNIAFAPEFEGHKEFWAGEASCTFHELYAGEDEKHYVITMDNCDRYPESVIKYCTERIGELPRFNNDLGEDSDLRGVPYVSIELEMDRYNPGIERAVGEMVETLNIRNGSNLNLAA